MAWYKIGYLCALSLIVYGTLTNNFILIGAGCAITPIMGLIAD